MKTERWKIERDPFYAELLPVLGEAGIYEAGFFTDASDEHEPLGDGRWLTTPLGHARRRLTSGTQRPVILVAPGAFCPVREGHLRMLDAARAAAEAAGLEVLAGLLAPSHDEIVEQKYGPDALGAARRLELCAAAASTSDWIHVDPWPSLGRQVAVNFTDLVARTELYARRNLRDDVEVALVCGADDARFALTFALRGLCVVVERAGAGISFARYRDHALLRGCPRILWASGGFTEAPLPARAGGRKAPALKVALGLEGPAMAAAVGVDEARWQRFQRDLAMELQARIGARFRTRMAAPRAPAVKEPPPVEEGALEEGEEAGDEEAVEEEHAAPRPMRPYLSRKARNALEAARVLAVRPRELSADAADFFLGSTAGGVEVELPSGEIARAPLVFPYADPTARCGLPAREVTGLSRRVWEINRQAFADLGLRVADLPEAARRVLHAAGFATKSTLEDVCTWHEARL